MLKRELVQHMRRLWRVLLAILLAYLIVSAIIMQRIASNISSLRDMDTWIKFLPFSYSLFYGITIAFLVILFFFYTLRTIADYRRGKTRWMLLAYTEKMRIFADALLFTVIIIIFYILSLSILYLSFQHHLQLLNNRQLYVPEEYRSFPAFLAIQNAYPLLYPSSFSSFAVLLSLFLSIVTGTTSIIHELKAETSKANGWIYIGYLVLVYLCYTVWHSAFWMMLIPLLFSIIFTINIKRCCYFIQRRG
ncbi:hypothetical protein MKA58_17815 [[Clostridium] innocuum]|nr:hypothetical protein [[Clostridium] innocuum]